MVDMVSTYRVIPYCMEDLHVESAPERLWSALLQQVQEALHVVEEAVSTGNTYKDLSPVSNSTSSLGTAGNVPRIK